MTLTDFLLARIAEDEATARWGRIVDDPSDPDSDTKVLRWDHDRLRVECEAKRWTVTYQRTLESLARGMVSVDPTEARSVGDHAAGLMMAVRTLAAIYADHPDYRDEWKP